MFQLYILDWSGTVSDDRRPVYEANMRVLHTFGKQTMTFEEWSALTAISAPEFFKSQGIAAGAEELFNLYRKHYAFIKHNGSPPQVYTGVPALIRELRQRGRIVAVVSTHPEDEILEEAARYGIALDLIRGNLTEKVAALREVIKKFDCTEAETVFIGDTIYDIRAAKQAGVRAGAVTCGYHAAEALLCEAPDYFGHSLSDIVRAIEAI